jgi:acid phosphatase
MHTRALVLAWTFAIVGAAGLRGGAPSAAGSARDTHENLNAVLWQQGSAEYQAILRGVYRLAAEQLDRALQDSRWTAIPEQAGRPDLPLLPPAVILDVDETVLDNSPEEAQRVLDRAPYDPARFPSWAGRSLDAFVPGAGEFLRYARGQKVEVFLVTNRSVDLKSATITNLRRLGLEFAENHVLCLGESQWTRDKSARRLKVAADYRVLLLVGDDLGDFVSVTTPGQNGTLQLLPPSDRQGLIDRYSGYWENRWFILPNPMYGSWEQSLYPPTLPDAQALQAKRDALRGN